MARLRLWRRAPLVWLTVTTLVVAATLLALLEPLEAQEREFPHGSSRTFANTPQERQGNPDGAPHLVFEDKKNLKDGTSWASGKTKDFESTFDVVAGSPKNQEAQQPLKNGHVQKEEKFKSFGMGQRMGISTALYSTLSPQTTTVSSEGFIPSTISSPFTTEENNQTYLNSSDYYYYDYYYDEDDYHQVNVSDVPVNNVSVKYIAFEKIIFLCEYIFSAIFEEYTSFTDNVVSIGNSSLSLVYDEKFMSVCLRLFELFDISCQDKNFLTICPSEDIVFLHPHNCQKPSSEDLYFHYLLATTLVEEDEECFRAVCEGSVRVVEREVEGVLVRLISPNVTSCHRYLQQYYQERLNETTVLYRTRNRYWPCCFPGYDVVWLGKPQALALVGKDWSYLPSHCRASEKFLVVLVMCVVVGGVLGNLLVLTLLTRRGHEGRPSTTICISLALADLLLSLFVLAPSLHSHLSLMHNTNSLQTPVSDVDEVDGGFQVFSAVVLSLCCIISQLNMFALSLERFLFANDITEWRNVFTWPQTKGFIFVTWTSSLVVALVLTCTWDGMVVMWSSFDKLPFGASPPVMKNLVPTVIAFLGIVCLLTGALSVQAVRNYMKAKARKDAKLEELGDIDLDHSGDQPHHGTVHMIFITILFICSTLMGGLACVLHLSAASFPHVELVRYLCWWVFLGATSWNPWLYNLDDTSAFLKTVLSKSLIR